MQVDLFDEDNVFCEGAQADETARRLGGDQELAPSCHPKLDVLYTEHDVVKVAVFHTSTKSGNTYLLAKSQCKYGRHDQLR